MSFEDRWEAGRVLMQAQRELINSLMRTLTQMVDVARGELKSAKVRADAVVYENKAVIGGTIVGCIARLEAIRATNPFAILVEEASEVLEPLLFSCLGENTRKFEMIGDHLQLQPGVRDKFDFERVNKINVSMFERLGQLRLIRDVLINKHRAAALLPPPPQRGPQGQGRIQLPSIRLSTVDRFQGDEADIILISMVVDATSRTPFVKLQNRMIVLLSRARLGMVLIGHEDYFNAVQTDHWKKTVELLDSPGKFDSSESLRSSVPLFEGARRGSSLPISCPKHPESRREAAGVGDLKLGFCQKRCENTLSCGHDCGLICHFPTDKHQKKCSVQVTSPCALHPTDRECHEIFRHAPGSAGKRVEEAVNKFFKCPEKVRFTLPCKDHEALLSCWNVTEIQQNRQQPPECKEKALSPFVFPSCQHSLEVLCKDKQAFERDHSLAPKCQFTVSFTPTTCSHAVKLPCWKKAALQNNPRSHVCEVKVRNFSLPRCGHPAKALSCAQHQQLLKWTGQGCATLGVVVEGEPYGPSDHHCTEKVTLKRTCGHSKEGVACHEAFQMASDGVQCDALVTVKLPHCGHDANVQCHLSKRLENAGGTRDMVASFLRRLTRSSAPLSEIREDGLQKLREKYRAIPDLVEVRCEQKIRVVRDCGHVEELRCLECSAGVLPPCQALVERASPLCGHAVKVPCHLIESFESFRPWEESASLSLSSADASSLSAAARLCSLPASAPLLEAVLRCKEKVRVVRDCMHIEEQDCAKLGKALKSAVSGKAAHSGQTLEELLRLGPCAVEVTKPLLLCGHMRRAPCHPHRSGDSSLLACEERVEVPCWNVSCCGQERLEVACKAREKPAHCGTRSVWKCTGSPPHCFEDRHCEKGAPSGCHVCDSDRLNQMMDEAREVSAFPQTSLPACLEGFANSAEALASNPGSEAKTQYKLGVVGALTVLGGRREKLKGNPSKLPRPDKELVEVFVVLQGNTAKRKGFHPVRDFIQHRQTQGVPVALLTAENLRRLAGSTGMLTCTLLIGYACVVNMHAGMQWAKKPNEAQRQKQWLFQEGFSSTHSSLRVGSLELDGILFWAPLPVYATHRVSWTKAELEQAATAMQGTESPDMFSRLTRGVVELQRPKQLQKGKSPRPPEEESSAHAVPAETAEESNRDTSAEFICDESLCGSPLEGLTFSTKWGLHEDRLDFLGALDDKTEKRAAKVLKVLQKESPPFTGKRWAEGLLEKSERPFLRLLLSLELLELGHPEEGGTELDNYLQNAAREGESESNTGSGRVHPLALLAVARRASASDEDQAGAVASRCLCVFFERFRDAGEILLTEEEKEIAISATKKQQAADGEEDEESLDEGGAALGGARGLWEQLKKEEPAGTCDSEAMEKLLNLTGLKKVKITAVQIYKTALKISRMPENVQQENAPALNFVFLGNPGTGKTTVAKLLAAVLRDAGARKKDTFVDLTAQQAKDEGMDKFREKVEAADGGVLFIDEAYDLDPVGDAFKGRPVVNELLTVSENRRASLSIILAGYEDDMNEKFFKYNDGLRSRFREIRFDDFDEKELLEVWNSMREKKGVVEKDERLGEVAVRRLLRRRNQKGFGNAREVRAKLETAAEAAMSREDFDGATMELRTRDVVGEDPRLNPKLSDVLQEIDSRVGWTAIKKAVRELVDVCGENFQRELQGQSPLPVLLNRLFIGNPGTGKTTCAHLYGRLLKHLGLLSSGDVVSKTASDLIGDVVGASQKKMGDIINGARGKVLLIDEAYALDDSLYGKQALDVIVEKVQGGDSDDIAVLLLGYERQLKDMLRNQNPGLSRRFPLEFAFRFDDYNDSELLEILKFNLKKQNATASLTFKELAVSALAKQRDLPNFGNAGAVEQLLKVTMQTAAARIRTAGGSSSSSLRLELEDLRGVKGAEDPARSDETKGDPLDQLRRLNKMEKVIEKLEELRSRFVVAEREGGERPDLGHFVFIGSPGTGKTTVARIMAKVLSQLGLLARDTLIETSGLDLTGEFVGQTKKKVTEKLDCAKGGVLFIDEAYELGKGAYGQEAMTTLLAALTSEEYRGMVVILEGYERDISDMLDRNVGLKSRFSQYFHFPDWDVRDCVSGFGKLLKLDGWGNGRDVDRAWKNAQTKRAVRVERERKAGASEEKKGPAGSSAEESGRYISAEDVQSALGEMIKIRQPQSAPPSVAGALMEGARMLEDSSNADAPPPVATRSAEVTRAPSCVEECVEEEKDDMQRDSGVSDEIWAQLVRAKEEEKRQAEEEERQLKAMREEEERLRREEEEALRLFLEEQERLKREKEAEQLRKLEEKRRMQEESRRHAQEAARRAREDAERRRQERLKQEQAIKEKLRQISPCPAGFQWHRQGGGWRCGGGSHFVSDHS
uniref:AAA+ ATPase domain-containing protein n=1 Tax=Chromera velia CCMP2878 TaxID=1169474 RepID=A0A0G4I8T0_9ALVE|eukprot:Cvel_11946.t1-p1 / transcript=Cvel_11946.t1 / gene=Cvel_11946 / organism=Chromera_velia_CCMP2878 / gene_product=Protein CbbX, putative / transcript_product=Protein CbbX, putative / location=Cvel_scaffold765:34357-48412(+) / protein_length=2371 / sequence_SO=supercontig / SO=protein_coding / is_pseudo=false